MKPPKEKFNYLKEYCDATSLHGWFFYGGSTSDKKTSFSGFFWLFILVASMSAAVFVMGTTIQGGLWLIRLIAALLQGEWASMQHRNLLF